MEEDTVNKGVNVAKGVTVWEIETLLHLDIGVPDELGFEIQKEIKQKFRIDAGLWDDLDDSCQNVLKKGARISVTIKMSQQDELISFLTDFCKSKGRTLNLGELGAIPILP